MEIEFYMLILLEKGFICEYELVLYLLNSYDEAFYQNVMKQQFYTKCPFLHGFFMPSILSALIC